MLFYIGAPTRDELMPSGGNMICISDFKEFVIDVVSSVISTMNERIRLAEENARNPFVNRTTIYRTEDGQPICYCCLRVGHVAKYCWDRKYSCSHVPSHDLPQAETFAPVAAYDVEHLGKDMNQLVEELRNIAHDMDQPRPSLMLEARTESQSPDTSDETPVLGGEQMINVPRDYPNFIVGRGKSPKFCDTISSPFPHFGTAKSTSGILGLVDIT